MLFPSVPVNTRSQTYLALADSTVGDDLPAACELFAAGSESVASVQGPAQAVGRTPLLAEHSQNMFLHPGIEGHRLAGAGAPEGQAAGRNWSPRFLLDREPELGERRLAFHATDTDCGLELTTELEALPGGSLRIRHTLRNAAPGDYLLQSLSVRLPLADDQSEILDFAGRHERERQPQRHSLEDGGWVREFRWGRTGYEGPVVMVGTPGFDFHDGKVVCVQPAWSGNTVLRVDRNSATDAGVSAGELLLPGEIELGQGQEYSTPWVFVTASTAGLDPIMHSLHDWERTLPEHPSVQPVTLNVWEAVMFDHNLDKLKDIADRAARIGVERYVLDDGWFHQRRDDTAGLGDWWVDPEVWPHGLSPIVDYVHDKGMQFGLWFEPEMINPDSDTYRQHPDWAMRARSENPRLQRNQLVLDLTNPQAFDHVYRQMSAILEEYRIDYVKWDHNRDLLEAGSEVHSRRPAVHQQTEAYYRLLDKLRQRFPHIAWESCSSGGERIDLDVIERVKRFWNSDMTDALSRQLIQRWTLQTVAPEYIGAHISQPCSQQTHRSYSLDFRAATAVFCAFGIEWDIRTASPADLDRLALWIAWYKANRGFLHSGDFIRLDVADAAVMAHGVVAKDGSRAIIAHVQYEESSSNRGVFLRVPGLDPSAKYRLSWTSPIEPEASLESLDPAGPLGQESVSGEYLCRVGFLMPRCRPETVRMIEITRL
ncbi:alpha-galactosidase [Bifidobacterium actinocoloniiforme DSM 22766]|uniref:alpha-galactosidase n=1 Tax=Bifidobacterium actinocoloniiforme DSM 22766 TaxID=1437605 RepID=A0A086YWC8_9BIFI|nr:alpha-galactosidase [Bifidobacterium actinocoloniiforme]AKV55781.1 glycoside hydrolase [Bifidobacterium actinocoloniiforme DSM 22766]KFI38578.1 alpha-galactosidase [Bifidobacterium actinocoloniiforme DSM 22766]